MILTLSTIEQGYHLSLSLSGQPVRQNSRRLSRSATLDGGCVISDSGVSDADMTYTIDVADIGRSDADALWAMFQAEGMVHMSLQDGYFSGYIEKLAIENDTATITFMVFSKIA